MKENEILGGGEWLLIEPYHTFKLHLKEGGEWLLIEPYHTFMS